MITYKHTQTGHLMLGVLFFLFIMFALAHISALNEIPSSDSGTNLAIVSFMLIILFTISSFTTLTVSLDEKFLRLKFTYGIFKKKFLLSDIASAKAVKNRWYYGFGIRLVFLPQKVWIYNVSGFDAVEIVLKNGKVYRIGTDDPAELERVINQNI